MNSDILKGKWLQVRGDIKKAWGDLTDDEIDQMNGDMDKLAGKLQEKYGYSKDRAQKEVDEFRLKMDQKYH